MAGKLQTTWTAITTLVYVPILVLNVIGWAVAAIWLIILGEWRVLLLGVLFIAGSGMAISLILIPGMLFSGPAGIALEKGKRTLGNFLSFMSLLYTIVVMTIWCVWIFQMFTNTADKNSLLPMLVWSYGIALAPWMWLASKEQDDASLWVTTLAECAYILSIVIFLMGARIDEVAVVFSVIMLAGTLIRFLIIMENQSVLYSKKMTSPEITSAMDSLEEKLGGLAFGLVKEQIMSYLTTHEKEYGEAIKKTSVDQWLCIAMANIARNHVISGQYHAYRAVLNPVGESLLVLCDGLTDELVKHAILTKKEAKEEKEYIREQIELVG